MNIVPTPYTDTSLGRRLHAMENEIAGHILAAAKVRQLFLAATIKEDVGELHERALPETFAVLLGALGSGFEVGELPEEAKR